MPYFPASLKKFLIFVAEAKTRRFCSTFPHVSRASVGRGRRTWSLPSLRVLGEQLRLITVPLHPDASASHARLRSFHFRRSNGRAQVSFQFPVALPSRPAGTFLHIRRRPMNAPFSFLPLTLTFSTLSTIVCHFLRRNDVMQIPSLIYWCQVL